MKTIRSPRLPKPKMPHPVGDACCAMLDAVKKYNTLLKKHFRVGSRVKFFETRVINGELVRRWFTGIVRLHEEPPGAVMLANVEPTNFRSKAVFEIKGEELLEVFAVYLVPLDYPEE